MLFPVLLVLVFQTAIFNDLRAATQLNVVLFAHEMAF